VRLSDHVFSDAGGTGAARIDQKTLAELAGVSLPTIQRMEASTGTVRGVVETLIKVVAALDRAGVELIGEHARSENGGRGVRLKQPGPPRRVGG
jgi:transcriptional regulator with XRE-family HTH domain